jgi:predicted  nucleic acid-binding Zn-ribbon protein
LNRLADRVEKKTVRSEKELNDIFARAEHSLAQYYEAKGSESWTRKETSQAGRDLRASATHLERALTWAGQRIEEKSGTAIRDARDVAAKMEKEIAVAGSEASNAFEAIKKEIGASAHK